MKPLKIASLKHLFFFMGIFVGMNVPIEPCWSQDAGVDISQLPPQDMLEYGMVLGSLPVIKQSVAKGAHINSKEKVPLCMAIAGANRTAEQIEAFSSLTDGRPVSRESFVSIIRWLLQNGADPNLLPGDSSNNPPLSTAVEYRDLEIVALLLGSKADPNLRNQNGDTALHVLAGAPTALPYPYEKGPEIAKLLISKGAKNLKNDEGFTALALARKILRIIEGNDTWTSLPFYDVLIRSYKSLIEILAKL